jgi:2-pyrone-4,6-dicarboxylate lactonase
MLKVIGVERMVLVQPSVYGEDNRVMLKAMSETSLPARGVAVLSMDTELKELEKLHQAGIRGVRYNLVDVKNPTARVPLTEITAFAERIKPLGWHVEFLVHVDDYPDFVTLFRDFSTEIVVAHFGYFRPGCTPDNPGFQGLLELAEAGRCWVKLTGAYRVAAKELPYADVDAFAKMLINRASHRLLWRSDWPHVMIKKTMPDDGHLADTLMRYASDSGLRKRILVDNPLQL